MRRSRRSRFPVETLPRTDGEPRRAHTSLNLRKEEKIQFDHLHSWWALRRGQPLSQPDAFSVLLALALDNERADLPPELRRGP